MALRKSSRSDKKKAAHSVKKATRLAKKAASETPSKRAVTPDKPIEAIESVSGSASPRLPITTPRLKSSEDEGGPAKNTGLSKSAAVFYCCLRCSKDIDRILTCDLPRFQKCDHCAKSHHKCLPVPEEFSKCLEFLLHITQELQRQEEGLEVDIKYNREECEAHFADYKTAVKAHLLRKQRLGGHNNPDLLVVQLAVLKEMTKASRHLAALVGAVFCGGTGGMPASPGVEQVNPRAIFETRYEGQLAFRANYQAASRRTQAPAATLKKPRGKKAREVSPLNESRNMREIKGASRAKVDGGKLEVVDY